jgi:hypothetical protein
MGKKKCWVCRGFRVIFDTFQCFIATALFSIKNTKFRCVFRTFCILRFFAFCTFCKLWHFGKKCRKCWFPPNSRRPCCAERTNKTCFRDDSQFPEITKVSQSFGIPEFRNFQGLEVWKASVFYTFISDYSLKLWKNTRCYLEISLCIFRDFGISGKHNLRIFDISGFRKSRAKDICLYFIIDFKY